eukprot:3224252-Lingulodinium_polyedra.AAC.1
MSPGVLGHGGKFAEPYRSQARGFMGRTKALRLQKAALAGSAQATRGAGEESERDWALSARSGGRGLGQGARFVSVASKIARQAGVRGVPSI